MSIQIGYSLQCSTVIVFAFQFLHIGPIKIVIKLGSMSNSVGKPIAVTVHVTKVKTTLLIEENIWVFLA